VTVSVVKENLSGFRWKDDMYVYIIKLVTRDGYIIKHVCATPEKAVELPWDAGHKYLVTGDANRVVVDRESLVKLLLSGKEFFLANTRDWSGDLLFVSRYVLE
jgi:hypothetical protein